jgi:predicted outer membrane protein
MRLPGLALITLCSVLMCLAAGVAVAQDKPADNMEVLREKLRADKKAVVAEVLQLTEGEAKEFWPVYNAYQSDMVSHYDRLLKLIETYAQSYETMTDATATSLLKQYLGLERDHVAILTSYLPRFQKMLPPKKVAKLYQVENKARALVNYELARGIPIVK